MTRDRNLGSQLADALKSVLKASAKKPENEPGRGNSIPGNTRQDRPQPCELPASWGSSAQTAVAPSGARDPGEPVPSTLNDGAPVVDKPTMKTPQTLAVRQTGKYSPPRQFDKSVQAARPVICPALDGIAGQISSDASDEADLILGLDFGTSSVKAVIRDTVTGAAYAVPFFADGHNRYLLPSRVYLTDERFMLDRGATVRRDLKLRLLNSEAESPVTEFEDACAFLALVIRHCRGWLLDAYGPRYQHHQLYWRLNLGLPARSYEDKGQVLKFRRLAWAAANLAADPNRIEITRSGAAEYRELSRELLLDPDAVDLDDLFPFRMQDTDVVPEIAAQFFGFSRSAKWDFRERPMMMLCDIGAGTVDCAFFSVTRQDDGLIRFAFFSDDVQPFGVMNLHRARVDFVRDALKMAGLLSDEIYGTLDEISMPTDQETAIPENLSEYHQGFEIDPPVGAKDFDTEYYHHNYHSQVIRCLRRAKTEKDVPTSQLQGLPIFLCGGGSRMQYYARIAASPGWGQLGADIRIMRLPVPVDLVAPSLPDDEFDRLSVAYGLAWQGDENVEETLGKIVRSIDIPPIEKQRAFDYTQLYTSKDHC